jgi:hypothetical protein
MMLKRDRTRKALRVCQAAWRWHPSEGLTHCVRYRPFLKPQSYRKGSESFGGAQHEREEAMSDDPNP